MQHGTNLREQLVGIALEWEAHYGVAPSITSALAETDAARIVGCDEADYCKFMKSRTAVSKGFDFIHKSMRYQVKANRPSGKPGSKVTLVGKANNFEWDRLIWILYDREYLIKEAWSWDCEDYKTAFGAVKRLSPDHMRRGRRLV